MRSLILFIPRIISCAGRNEKLGVWSERTEIVKEWDMLMGFARGPRMRRRFRLDGGRWIG